MATRPRLARPFDTPPRTRAAPGRIERFPQTVHGGTHFAAERWIQPIVHGSTVHGSMSWFSMRKPSWGLSHHDSGTAPASSLDDVPDDEIRHIASVSATAAALLAQCSKRLHALMRETPALRKLVRFEEHGTLEGPAAVPAQMFGMRPTRAKYWVRNTISRDDGRLLAISHGARDCWVRSITPPSPLRTLFAQEPGEAMTPWLVAVTDLSMPMDVASHGALTVISDKLSHAVHVYSHDEPQAEIALMILTAPTMRSPCGVATDGARAFVCGGAAVHVFEIASGECTATWPTLTAEGKVFECEHGVALHNGELFVVDQRGARIHVFGIDHHQERGVGAHLRDFGGRGEAPGRFLHPWGVASCGDHIVVSEHSGRRVQIFTADGRVVGRVAPAGAGCLAGVWAGFAGAGPSGADCAEAAAQERPRPRGVVLVSDWDRCVVHALSVTPWYDYERGY